jgi:hypothetical protein
MKTEPTRTEPSGAKWLPGAMAITATTSGAHAAIVQITLSGNKISSTEGNQLNSDLTGDNTQDLLFSTFIISEGVYLIIPGLGSAKAWVNWGNIGYVAMVRGDQDILLGGGTSYMGRNLKSITGMLPITFSDTRINRGGTTEAWVELKAYNSGTFSHTAEFSRLIFNDASMTLPFFEEIPGVLTEWQASAVPEPSGFAATSLLLGAAGLIRRRKERAARPAQ